MTDNITVGSFRYPPLPRDEKQQAAFIAVSKWTREQRMTALKAAYPHPKNDEWDRRGLEGDPRLFREIKEEITSIDSNLVYQTGLNMGFPRTI